MQLMIDISVETPAALRLAAQFFIDHAALKEASEAQLRDATPPAIPTGAPLPPVPPAPPAPSAVVLPFVQPAASPAPPAPPAPTNLAPPVTTPATSSANTASASSAAPVLPGASVAPPADEYDSAGVPWDARIHQKKKGQKKDKTWKLQKGIADALVSTVMQELAPRIRKAPVAPAAPPAPDAPPAGFGHTPLPAGAPAPVSLPPVPPLPPVAGTPAAQTPVAPPPPPPASVETVTPQADPFRALVKKVTEARGQKRLTAEEVTQCCALAGVPGLQALNAMPHLIATVEANIDALLASR